MPGPVTRGCALEHLLKFQIIFWSFIVDGGKSACGIVHFKVPETNKCTAEASTDEVAVDEVPAGRGLAPARWTIKRGAWWMV